MRYEGQSKNRTPSIRTVALFLLITTAISQFPNHAQAQEIIGPCLIQEIYKGNSDPKTIENKCRQLDQAHWTSRGGRAYQLSIMLYKQVFENAENAFCGFRTCISKGRAVKIVVYQNNLANAAIWWNDEAIYLEYSSGLFDFAYIVGSLLARDLRKKSRRKLKNLEGYWDRMRDYGTKQCTLRPWSDPVIKGPVDEKLQSTLTALILNFVAAHELAHVATGGNCNYEGSDSLGLEAACDKLGVSTLWNYSEAFKILPFAVVAWKLSLANQEALFGPLFAKSLRFRLLETPIHRKIPARNFQRRAEMMINLNEEICSKGDKNMGCHYKLISEMRKWVRRKLPQPCSLHR